MMKYLAEFKSPGCGHSGSLTISGSGLAGPAGLRIVCGVCGKEGEIDSYQTIERLPMVFGNSKSYYEVTVSDGKMTIDLRPNLPIYCEALKVDWQEQLDGKTGEEMLTILDRGIADMVTRPDHYRSRSDTDWFGYDETLTYLKNVRATCHANPKIPVQLRLTIGDKRA